MSLPEIRLFLSDDVAVFDQQTTPRDDAAIVKKVVSDNREFRPMMSARVRITNLASLDKRAQKFLPIFQTGRDVGIALRSPVKIEIVSGSLSLIERSDSAEDAVARFEINRRFGDDRGGPSAAAAGMFFLRRLAGLRGRSAQQEELDLAEFKIAAQRRRQRVHFFEHSRFVRSPRRAPCKQQKCDHAEDAFHPAMKPVPPCRVNAPGSHSNLETIARSA